MNVQAVSRIVFSMGLALSITTLAEAQATRTWVSGVGDDANPCSRTAPCKTWAGAISKTATGGVINALDPGGFGSVTIIKSITLDGGGGPLAGILAAGVTQAILINNASAKVIIRNISIEGVGTAQNGIRVLAATAVHVDNVQIIDINGPAINFVPGASALLTVTNTVITNTQGVQVENGRATIDNLQASGGLFGVRARLGGLVTVRNSTLANGRTGVGTNSASAILNVENCVMTNNEFGVDASGGGTIRVSNSGILSNSNTGLFNDGISTITSLSGNTVQGNLSPGAFTGAAIPKE